MHRPGLLNQSDFVPVGHLVMSRDIIGCHNRDWVGSLASRKLRDAARYRTVHRTVPHSKELSSPQCRKTQV